MSFTRIAGEAACDCLGGGRIVEEVEHAALAVRQLDRMNNATQRRRFLDQGADAEGAKNTLRRHAFFGDGRIVRDSLTIQALHQVIRRQRDLEQVDERLDPLRRFEKERPDRQRRFPLMMGLLDVALLFELGEQGVGIARQRSRCEQRGEAIVVGIELGGGFVEMENKAMGRWTTTALRSRQRRTLGGAERHEFPAKVTRRTTFAEEFNNAAMDLHRIVPSSVASRDGLSDLLQTGANLGDRTLPLGLTDLLVGAGEDENQAAWNDFAGVGIGELMPQDGEFVAFFRQRRVASASAFLFDGQVAGVVPEEAFAMLVEEGLEIAPGHGAECGMAG